MALPNDFLSQQGPNVEMTTEKMERDAWADTMLEEIGKTVCGKQTANGMQYLGSFAFHIFADKGLGVSGKMSMGSITQIKVKEECSERMATLAFNNGVLQLRRYYKPSTTTGRRGDNR